MTTVVEYDDKDWTWVLERPCPECGFDASTFDPRSTAEAIRRQATEWVDLLRGDVDELRRRRRPDRWSDLEYAAHVRDVLRLYLVRLRLMLDTSDPLYPNWDQNLTAVEESYDSQDPIDVAAEIDDAAHRLAEAFDGVDESGWRRTGRRSDGASFTVDTFARYLVHDPIHHLWDVGRPSSNA